MNIKKRSSASAALRRASPRWAGRVLWTVSIAALVWMPPSVGAAGRQDRYTAPDESFVLVVPHRPRRIAVLGARSAPRETGYEPRALPGYQGQSPRLVSFRVDGGRTINALVVDANQRPAPAVVLVPMLGRPKDDWQAAALLMADANITALAIDLPGQTLPANAKALLEWHADIRAAVTYLLTRADVRATSVGVAGASLGANLAAVAAGADPRVRSLALVSPSLDYRGVRIEAPLRQYGSRPALLLASLRDAYAARSVKELAKDAPGVREVQWAETPAHGTVLLAREPEMARILVQWFQRTLG
jgi:dienelactone hydrolase